MGILGPRKPDMDLTNRKSTKSQESVAEVLLTLPASDQMALREDREPLFPLRTHNGARRAFFDERLVLLNYGGFCLQRQENIVAFCEFSQRDRPCGCFFFYREAI